MTDGNEDDTSHMEKRHAGKGYIAINAMGRYQYPLLSCEANRRNKMHILITLKHNCQLSVYDSQFRSYANIENRL